MLACYAVSRVQVLCCAMDACYAVSVLRCVGATLCLVLRYAVLVLCYRRVRRCVVTLRTLLIRHMRHAQPSAYTRACRPNTPPPMVGGCSARSLRGY